MAALMSRNATTVAPSGTGRLRVLSLRARRRPAWKSASSPSQSAPKSHGNPSKRSKGPIITKYAPPPPLPQPQPQPPSYGPGPGMGQYQPPPPPPGNHQHPSMYSAPPPAPHYPQYGPPPPSYPPGYAQPPYSYAPGQPHNSQQPRKGSSHTGKPVIASGSPGKKESTRSEQRSGGTNTHVQEPPTLAESGRDDEAVREKEADTPHDSPVTQMETAENSTPVDKPVDVNVAPERNVDDDAAETKTVSTDKEDGEIGNDDAVASTTSVPELAASDHHRQSVSNEPGVRDKRSRSNDPEERQRHKKRRPDSPAPKSDRTSESGTLNGTLWDGLAVPRQADRTRRGSAGSAGSRQSSVAGNSSDLNSLERELLGRPVKQKHRGDSPRSERKPAKAKRRQANANSAYRYVYVLLRVDIAF
ncbi:Mitochondrial distribution and morphology family 33 protein [Purpureocillium lavendulum]|uniref:Mitochondrial distribution and morphology family 33 protein n=1 Tax=Purpureocillium lavendulum TaxID=1247861 RepID=A0AB34G8J0_9HYPO|nr:Mitochondrial distribution and morphology family 33 protein [Purpureocillium lavendulum]